MNHLNRKNGFVYIRSTIAVACVIFLLKKSQNLNLAVVFEFQRFMVFNAGKKLINERFNYDIITETVKLNLGTYTMIKELNL